MDFNRYNPSINTTFFPDTVAYYYWSSTTDAYDTSYAWLAYFNSGVGGNGLKSDSLYVRAVRGGQPDSPCPSEKVVNDTAMTEGDAVLASLRTFRDGFLSKSQFGQSISQLYYRHSAEGIRLLMNHPEWVVRSAALLEQLQPALVNATSTGVLRLDASILQEITSLMDEVTPYASPELNRFLDFVQSRLENGRVIAP